jgi:hypothetical protein
MDFLPTSDIKIADDWTNMFWKYGQRILKAENLSATIPASRPVYHQFQLRTGFISNYLFQKIDGDKAFVDH